MVNHPIIAALGKISCQKETKILFGGIFTPYQLKKRAFINIPTSVQQRPLYFLDKGLLHLSEQSTNKTPNNNAKTIRFYQSGQFFVHPVLKTTETSPHHPYQLSALTESTLYQTTYQKIQALYHIDRQIADIILTIQDQYNQEIFEEISMLHQPGIDRYQAFIQKLGLDHLHIPKKHLASYLLLSTKQLGRITKQFLRRT